MSVSVALLLPGVGSVTPLDTVAVLTNDPVADALIVQVAVNVALPPLGRFTALVLIFPLPLAGHVPLPAPAHVQLQPVTSAGNVSATVAPVTLLGPTLDAAIV